MIKQLLNKIKGRHIVIGLILLVLTYLIIYNTVIVRTIESNNGWKHQVGHFGVCDFEFDGDCQEATHRIRGSFYTAGVYCDSHWNGFGQSAYDNLVDKNDSRNTDAKICAEEAVRSKLKSPTSAKFCSYSEMTVVNLGNNKWKISGYVDADNSFGSKIRQNWTVTLTLTKHGFENYTVDFS